jgi:HAD superfamily hydrolase (TIGR01548 family)
VRITVPGDPASFDRLAATLTTALAPECLLFDLDGVIADVSGSYRKAIVATAATYGVVVSDREISAAKAAGNANDDWTLTRRLCLDSGVTVSQRDLTTRFQAIYHGSNGGPGLKESESPLVDTATLRRWRKSLPLGVVTGRPRDDAVEFLDRFGMTGLFDTLVTREDAPLKPDPAPVRLAMANLDAGHAWMLGDSRDDLVAARRAGAVPIGVVAPGETREDAAASLAGAAAVLDSLSQLQEILDATNI